VSAGCNDFTVLGSPELAAPVGMLRYRIPGGSMPMRNGGGTGGHVMALYKVRMTEGITMVIEDDRGIETLAADLARMSHLFTSRPQIASRKVIGRSPIALMAGNVVSIELTTVDG
jgi:hypothetical protein